MKYRLDEAAIDDLQRIRSHIAKQNRQAALDMIDRLFDAIEKLAEFPLVGERMDSLRQSLRRFSVKPYVIYFRSANDVIEIVRVLHGAQDAEAELAE